LLKTRIKRIKIIKTITEDNTDAKDSKDKRIKGQPRTRISRMKRLYDNKDTMDL